MKNDLFSIGPFTVHGYGLMIAVGIIAAYLTAEYRAKKMELESEKILNLLIWCVAGGLLGAKLLYFITIIGDILSDPKSIVDDLTGGFVVYGGIIGGILAGFLYCKKAGLRFFQYFDLVMPSITLAQGFGRIGCIFAGCCYGLETSGPFHLIFRHSEFAPNGVPLIPTQPISSILDFLHFLVLVIFAKHKKADGQVAGLYLILYSAGRFILEFFRGDLDRGSVGGLSTSQFISVFLFAAGLILFIVRGLARNKTILNPDSEQ